MRSVIPIVLVIVCCLGPATAAQVLERAPKAVQQTLFIECPFSIQTGIVNGPPGWTPFVVEGAAKLPFHSVSVLSSSTGPVVTCFYGRQTSGFPAHSISRTLPKTAVCRVDNVGEHNRTVSCGPKATRER